MPSLPMHRPTCSLSDEELHAQLARYRRVGAGASVVISRAARRLEVRVGPEVAGGLVDELVATERKCCPFFRLSWDPAARRLVIGVDSADRESALSAIADAVAQV